MVGLILVLVFTQLAVTTSNDSYDPMADVNRDGIVDANDLSGLGKAYGSSYTPPMETNKTVVTVLQFENNSTYTVVENALVAVFPPDAPSSRDGVWKSTNSSGTATFELDANTSYVTIAWDENRTRYNYANFTTDSLGEAQVLVWLNYLQSLSLQPYSLRNIPKTWVVITFLDNSTNKPSGGVLFSFFNFTVSRTNDRFSHSIFQNAFSTTGVWRADYSSSGAQEILAPFNNVGADYGEELTQHNFTFRTDEYGGAYVVVPIYP